MSARVLRACLQAGGSCPRRGIHGTPNFDIYWAPKPAPHADAAVVDRIALWQIRATLRPLHKMALLALAAHGDYSSAAQAVGYPYGSFGCLISQAAPGSSPSGTKRRPPSHLWANNRHGDGDIEQRVQRTIAAKRRRMREELTD